MGYVDAAIAEAAKRRQGDATMSTFTKLTYHVVFSTKRRRPLITTFRERLYEYTGGIIRGLNGALLEIGGARSCAFASQFAALAFCFGLPT